MTKVIFYVPNLIGYVRLVFAIGIVVCHAFDRYQGAVIAYATSTVLDFFDGYFARKLNQCSKFGEFLDVLADNIARTILWMCLWKQLSEECNWKDLPHNKVPPPYIIRKVFENGFKNIWGTLAVSGLFLLPLYLYMSSFGLMEDIPFMLIILICCRVFCAIVECWIVMNHIRTMIVLDTKGTK